MKSRRIYLMHFEDDDGDEVSQVVIGRATLVEQLFELHDFGHLESVERID